jgi:hypothetical protein
LRKFSVLRSFDIDYVEVTSVKTYFGMTFATLCPIFWNQWLYSEMFETGSGRLFMGYRFFMWIGFSFVAVTSTTLLLGLLRGTL